MIGQLTHAGASDAKHVSVWLCCVFIFQFASHLSRIWTSIMLIFDMVMQRDVTMTTDKVFQEQCFL